MKKALPQVRIARVPATPATKQRHGGGTSAGGCGVTPPEVRVDISHGPADAAQLSAWTWLWRRLLAPENSDASEGVTPEASERGTPGPRTLEIVDVPQSLSDRSTPRQS